MVKRLITFFSIPVKALGKNNWRSCLFAFCLLFSAGFAVAETENQPLSLSATVEVTTAGQVLELILSTTYDEGVEVFFNPDKQDWQSLEFLGYRADIPRWQNGRWLQKTLVKVTALVPGDYNTPLLTLDYFRDGNHWVKHTAALPLKVVSGFDEEPLEVQKTIELPEKSHERTGHFLLGLLGFASALLLGGGVLHRNRKRQIKPVANDDITPEQLADQALDQGVMDWEDLRRWLYIKTGADVRGQLTANEPLLRQYQTLRFSGRVNPERFAEFCVQCQVRWG